MPYMGAVELKDADIKRGSATGDGSTVAYAIGWIPPNEQSMFITINGVMQQDAAYTISSSTLTFAAAPASADAIEWRGIQSSGTIVTPADGTVGESKLADEAVVVAKLATTGTPTSSTFLSGTMAWGTPTGNGKLLQVVSTNMNTTFTYTGTTYSDVTGLSLSITPSATSSKILVSYDTVSATTGSYKYFLKVVRLISSTTTQLGLPATAGSRILGQIGQHGWNTVAPDMNGSFTYLDSPSTTSAITYKVQVSTEGAWYLNRSVDDTDNDNFGRYVSNITAMEIGA